MSSLITARYPFSLFTNFSQPAYVAIEVIKTDADYKCPAYRGLLVAAAKKVPAWTYLFSHSPSCSWYPFLPQDEVSLFGATHSAEIPYVFNNTKDLPLYGGNCSFKPAELEISKTLTAAWTSIAESGNPSPDGGLEWPVWNASTSSGLVIVNSSVIGTVDYSICEFWDHINALEIAAMEANASTPSTFGNSTEGSTHSGAAGGLFGCSLGYIFAMMIGIGVYLLL